MFYLRVAVILLASNLIAPVTPGKQSAVACNLDGEWFDPVFSDRSQVSNCLIKGFHYSVGPFFLTVIFYY